MAEHGDLEHVFVGRDNAGANITHNMLMDYAPDQAAGSSGMKIKGIALLLLGNGTSSGRDLEPNYKGYSRWGMVLCGFVSD